MPQNPNSGRRILEYAVLTRTISQAEIPSLRNPAGLVPPPPGSGEAGAGTDAEPHQGGLHPEITGRTSKGHRCLGPTHPRVVGFADLGWAL